MLLSLCFDIFLRVVCEDVRSAFVPICIIWINEGGEKCDSSYFVQQVNFDGLWSEGNTSIINLYLVYIDPEVIKKTKLLKY